FIQYIVVEVSASDFSIYFPSRRLNTASEGFFFFQAEDGIRYRNVTGVQTCALPISMTTRLDSSGAKSGQRNFRWAWSTPVSTAPMPSRTSGGGNISRNCAGDWGAAGV